MPHLQMNALGCLDGWAAQAEQAVRDALRKLQADQIGEDEQPVEDDLIEALACLGRVRKGVGEKLRR